MKTIRQWFETAQEPERSRLLKIADRLDEIGYPANLRFLNAKYIYDSGRVYSTTLCESMNQAIDSFYWRMEDEILRGHEANSQTYFTHIWEKYKDK